MSAAGSSTGVCEQCSTPMPIRTDGPGRRRRYCSDACRQAASRARAHQHRQCQVRLGSAACRREATGRVFGVGILGAPLRGLVEVEVCDACAPMVVAWVTINAGAQPTWHPFGH